MSTKSTVEVKSKAYDDFTVTTVEAPAMQFNRFKRDGDHFHTGANFHDVTDLETEQGTVTTDAGTYPTTVLTFKCNGERVRIVLFGVQS